MAIELIVGLGNPGPEYDNTRHNAGANFVEDFARQSNVTLQPDNKFFGRSARVQSGGVDVRLLIPTTFMNESGRAVAAVAGFYKIAPENILVAHDELDLPPGTARLKKGGGAGGHNGLKDIIRSLGNQQQFCRLRIGVGHPGSASQVVGYVLKKASSEEQRLIDDSIDESLKVMPLVLAGDWEKAMKQLHTKKSTSDK